MPSSILARRHNLGLVSRILTSDQLRADQLLLHGQQALSDPIALSAMGIAPLFGKVGRFVSHGGIEKIFGSSKTAWAHFSQRTLSRVAGFGTEIFAFEGVQRGLRVSIEGAPRSLLEWKSFKEGLLHSSINIGLLKSAGLATANTNLIFNHFATDAAMVAGNQAAAALGMIAPPTQSLVHQWVEAHAMNWQMKAGLAVFHRSFPNLVMKEKALDVNWKSRIASPLQFSPKLASVMAAEGVEPAESRHLQFREKITEHLGRFADYLGENPQALKKIPGLTLFALHGKVAKIEKAIFPEIEIFDFEQGDRLYRAASQFQRVLESWNPRVPLSETVGLITLLEQSLEGNIGTLLVEREVRAFVAKYPSPATSVPKTAKVRARAAVEEAAPREIKPYDLRHYQRDMLEALYNDVLEGTSPWLGLASPMQTGKSFLAGPAIQKLRAAYGAEARFIVLSSAKVITRQVLDDLLEGFPASEVGVYDAHRKEIKSITVASVYTLIRHLDAFSHKGPTILINDEAYFTQAPMYRKIYTHFNLGEIVSEGGREIMKPKAGNGLVLGLSGTGAGLEGYKLSEQLNILDAISLGWIRPMKGDRVVLTIESERKETVEDHDMIWWKATEQNAEALADIYDQKIFGQYRRSSIYVPTIEHAELLKTALRKRHGENHAFAVHSEMQSRGAEGSIDRNFDQVIQHWETNGGAVISIGQLSRGYRGKGIDACFHTYQSSSVELFAQRTGRGWGGNPMETLPEYYVLEVAWDKKSRYANLARLLGLVDYPPRELYSREVSERMEKLKSRQAEKVALTAAVRTAKVVALFERVPLLQEWRRDFSQALDNVGGVNALAKMSGLSVEELTGYALGALPVHDRSVKALQGVMGENWTTRWADNWKSAALELREGLQSVEDSFSRDLINWAEAEANASNLGVLLHRYFPPSKAKKLRGMSALIEELRSAEVLKTLDESALEKLIGRAKQELESQLSPLQKAILNRRIFAEKPELAKGLASEFDRVISAIGNVELNLKIALRREAIRLRQQDVFRERQSLQAEAEKTSSDRDTNPFLDHAVEDLNLSVRTAVCFQREGIKTVRELIEYTEADLLKINNFGRKTLREVKELLATMGLALKRRSEYSAVHAISQQSPPNESVENPLKPFLDIPINENDFSVRARNALDGAGFRYLGELVQRTEAQLLAKKNVGRKTLRELKEILRTYGLHLGMEVLNWSPPLTSED